MSKPVSILAALLGVVLLYQTPAARAQASEPLRAFIASVLQDSPDARTLEASLDAAAARYEAADQPLYNPELELDGEKTNVRTRSIGVSQTIDWAGKRRARSAMAAFQHKKTAAQARLARQQLATRLLRALAEYQAADELNRLGLQRTALMRQFADIAGKRQAAGDLNQVEFDLAKLAALQADLEGSELASRLTDAEGELLRLTGATHGPWPALPADTPEWTGAPNADALLAAHPAQQLQQAAMDSARATVELRRREAKPDPTLNLRAGREGSDRLAGLSLSLPLYVRNRYRAEVAEASALLTGAEQAARANRLTLQTRLDAASQRYQRVRRTWSNWQTSGETSLRRRTSLLKRLWQAGELSTTEYLVQLRQTLETQAAAVELRGRLWQAWADWLQASGTVFQWLNLADDLTETISGKTP